MKILILEDHPDLATALSGQLRQAGYATDIAPCANHAIAMLNASHYDALLLDLGLPDIDGMTLLQRELKQRSDMPPCIVITARDGIESRIDALDAGADDYLQKPFDVQELMARLRAVLRRPGSRQQQQLRFGNLAFDSQQRLLQAPEGSQQLPRREAMLLEILLKNAPQIVIKDQLEERLYGLEEEVSINAVEALVSRTRRKMKQLGASCGIETIRGIGYRLTLELGR